MQQGKNPLGRLKWFLCVRVCGLVSFKDVQIEFSLSARYSLVRGSKLAWRSEGPRNQAVGGKWLERFKGWWFDNFPGPEACREHTHTESVLEVPHIPAALDAGTAGPCIGPYGYTDVEWINRGASQAGISADRARSHSWLLKTREIAFKCITAVWKWGDEREHPFL